jgi:hypothetical protein
VQQRIIVAIGFGLSAVLGSLQINGLPHDRDGWIGVAIVFVVAAWGKYSSSTTIVGPDREVWTPERRMVEAVTPKKGA